VTTKILGTEQLKSKMRRFPAIVVAELRKALEQNAEEMVKLAKSIVPVDDGDLRESIGWTYGEAPAGSFAIGQVKASGARASNLRITIYAGNERAFYARWVEFGTKAHFQPNRGRQHPGTRATGFFYGSYRALRKRMKGRVTRALRKSAQSVAASGVSIDGA
jgi:hypothetical protein